MHYIWKYRPICLFDHYSQHDIPAYLPATQPLPFEKQKGFSESKLSIKIPTRLSKSLQKKSSKSCVRKKLLREWL